MAARKDGLPKLWRPRQCKKCNRNYIPTCATQIYCGSKTKKVGCSWDMVHERDRIRGKLPHRKAMQRRLEKEWKKRQRKAKTDYALRQKALKLAYYKSDRGKEIARLAAKRNIKVKLECNRRRVLRKRKAIGSHSLSQWNNLREICNFKCAFCGISEWDIKIKWPKFPYLTRDHIIPISRGGTDYISNIQPLCISCNAKKRDKIYG